MRDLLTPKIPIVEVRTRPVRIIHVAFLFLAINRSRVLLVLVAWFGPFGSCLLFCCLFALRPSSDNGDVPDLFQKFAEDYLRCHSYVFSWIREVFPRRRVR